MTTLHVVSHTHWDREWYLTFQEFRFRLVRMMDGLLDLLDQNPDYQYFTLDGQTIILDDYLEIRPEQESRIRRHIHEGRLLVGPWYVLPDEFLSGPEVLLRNLLFGERGCRRFSDERQPMERIGYLPDPFGHIGQLPQIAAGLGWDAVCLWRGVGDAPTEFRWIAPDGSDCLVLYLRDSYSSGAWLATDDDGFVRDLAAERDTLAPHASSTQLLVMQGTDHMEARADLPRLLQVARAALNNGDSESGSIVLHSTLPRYLEAVQDELGTGGKARLPRRQGELRSPQSAHLLPAVLSARIWIKQQNARCETLLTRWAEPFAALARQVTHAHDHRQFLRKSWEYLLKNHPHDSICGCSTDQVHREMQTRFAWSEQIAEQVVCASLDSIATQINTLPGKVAQQEGIRSDLPGADSSIVVFNPTPFPRTDCVRVQLDSIPDGDWCILDAMGEPIAHRVLSLSVVEHFNMRMTRDVLADWLTKMAARQTTDLGGLFFHRLETHVEEKAVRLDVIVTTGPPDTVPSSALSDGLVKVQALLGDERNQSFHVRVLEEPGAELEFLARDVPGLGYAQYSVLSSRKAEALPQVISTGDPHTIENEYFTVKANADDGTLQVLDKTTGLELQGVNRFVDSGDRGDEYTYCPPEADLIVDSPHGPPTIQRVDDTALGSLEILMLLRLPQSLSLEDRSARASNSVDLPITSRVTLKQGVRRVEFETTVDNNARDHRLRVHFPTPIATDRSWAESQFDVIERPLALPTDTSDWIEQPVGTHPQLTFVDVSDGKHGVLLANRGLPEYEVLPGSGEDSGAIVALTLLRCVGWLSRADLHNRLGHAGPAMRTPEAQCPGRHAFHYALIPHAGNYLTAYREAHAFGAPLRAVPADTHDGPLPSRASFVEISPAAVVLSALKPPEEGEGLIVRVYNSSPVPVRARLKFLVRFREATLVSLLEADTLRSLARDSYQVLLPMGGKEIATLRLWLDGDQ